MPKQERRKPSTGTAYGTETWSAEAQAQIDAFLDALEFERMEAEDFIEAMSEEERSGRGSDRLLSETGGRVYKAKGNE